jgi:Undecaprenyl-phosphate galactose phosphotransferase WbaP
MNKVSKTFFDFSASLIGLIILIPVFITIIIIVKITSKGPAIYSHTRYGFNGKTFPAYKFRSMVLNADEILDKHLKENPSFKAEWQKDQKLKNDPRITLIGHILRKTSLDELPQLINVLKGEMSLVGPRPIVKNEIIKYGDVYKLYKTVRPGITGLWQVSGRNNTTYYQRVQYDLEYVTNWSFKLDIIILFKTIKVVLFRDGAY